jgi:hypothetical protein
MLDRVVVGRHVVDRERPEDEAVAAQGSWVAECRQIASRNV